MRRLRRSFSHHFHWTAIVLLACLVLSACGQKGDLYIPTKPEQPVNPSSD
jgi:predicted small lipoprotein YifL